MANTQSKLQIAYREFFNAMLADYGVKSPAKLGDKRSEFFSRIKKEWPKKKKQIGEGVLRQEIREMISETLNEEKKKFTVYTIIEKIKGKYFAIMQFEAGDMFFENDTLRQLLKTKISNYGKYVDFKSSDQWTHTPMTQGYYFLLNPEYQKNLDKETKKKIESIKTKVTEKW